MGLVFKLELSTVHGLSLECVAKALEFFRCRLRRGAIEGERMDYVAQSHNYQKRDLRKFCSVLQGMGFSLGLRVGWLFTSWSSRSSPCTIFCEFFPI